MALPKYYLAFSAVVRIFKIYLYVFAFIYTILHRDAFVGKLERDGGGGGGGAPQLGGSFFMSEGNYNDSGMHAHIYECI